MSIHTSIYGERNGSTGATVIYTNGSGNPQAIAIFDIVLSLSCSHDAAASTFFRSRVTCGGVDIMNQQLYVRGTGNAQIAVPWNLQGKQFFLANAATMTLTHDNGASFSISHVHIVCDILAATP